jgi:hypothetical protein
MAPKGQPESVQVHDFAKQKDVPYGVYDLGQNAGWVSVGTDHDTSAFAVESIRRWWNMMGREAYPDARQLLITADSGGSNGARVRLWKLELQKLAAETKLEISVCHFPPGTSKWNKIEHRLFSFITQNWRGKPLVSHEVIVNLIAATTTRTGLRVQSQLDTGKYPKGIKVSQAELATIQLRPETFHGAFVNSIWPTLILSFGPPQEPIILSLSSVLGDRGGAQPCAASFAARLGRSGGRGYQEPALTEWGPAHAPPDRIGDRIRWLRGPAFLPDTLRMTFAPSPVLPDTPLPQTGSRRSEPAPDPVPDSASTRRHIRFEAPLERPPLDPR